MVNYDNLLEHAGAINGQLARYGVVFGSKLTPAEYVNQKTGHHLPGFFTI